MKNIIFLSSMPTSYVTYLKKMLKKLDYKKIIFLIDFQDGLQDNLSKKTERILKSNFKEVEIVHIGTQEVERKIDEYYKDSENFFIVELDSSKKIMYYFLNKKSKGEERKNIYYIVSDKECTELANTYLNKQHILVPDFRLEGEFLFESYENLQKLKELEKEMEKFTYN